MIRDDELVRFDRAQAAGPPAGTLGWVCLVLNDGPDGAVGGAYVRYPGDAGMVAVGQLTVVPGGPVRQDSRSWVTGRLRLTAVDEVEARRIVAAEAGPGDRWAADFPATGEIVACTALLRAWAAHGDPRPFGFHRLDRLDDGRAVGGIGFHGPPDSDGVAEIGYALAPSARGAGLAVEAVHAILVVAIEAGVRTLVANTDEDDVASQHVLLRNGFDRSGFDRSGSDGPQSRFTLVLRPG